MFTWTLLCNISGSVPALKHHVAPKPKSISTSTPGVSNTKNGHTGNTSCPARPNFCPGPLRGPPNLGACSGQPDKPSDRWRPPAIDTSLVKLLKCLMAQRLPWGHKIKRRIEPRCTHVDTATTHLGDG